MSDQHFASPGWYPDPNDNKNIRYWDGEKWSIHVLPTSVSQPEPSSEPQNNLGPPPPTDFSYDKKPSWGLGDVATGIATFFLVTLMGGVAIVAVSEFIKSLYGSNLQTNEVITEVGFLISILAGAAALFTGFFLYPSSIAKRKGYGSLKKDFGLKFEWIDIPLGFSVAIVTIIGTAALGYLYEIVTGSAPQGNTSALSESSSSVLVLLAIVFTTVVVAPICEEVFFRGLVMRSLQKKFDNTIVSVAGSSLLFGVMHMMTGGSAAFVVISTSLFGLVFAALAVYTKRLGPAITAHAFLNAIVVTSTVLVGYST